MFIKLEHYDIDNALRLFEDCADQLTASEQATFTKLKQLRIAQQAKRRGPAARPLQESPSNA